MTQTCPKCGETEFIWDGYCRICGANVSAPDLYDPVGEWAAWPTAGTTELDWPDAFAPAGGPTRETQLPEPEQPEMSSRRRGAVWSVGQEVAGTYRVLDVHGQGGMGLVYRVRHLGWGVEVAVKSPRPELFRGDADRRRFAGEAETWVSLGLHPHVCSCHYVRTIDDIPRVFAEYVEGGSLRDWIDDGRLYAGAGTEPLGRVLDLAIQTAWGLAHAHELGVVHQDVKPANVLVDGEGIAKVTDFGLAKAGRVVGGGPTPTPRDGTVLTSVGGMTLAYASPEQVAGGAVGRRSDVWSFAVSVLEMFTGAVTWMSGPVAGAALAQYRRSGDGLRLALPHEVAELLARCLRDDPDERPSGIAAVADGLVEAYQRLLGHRYARSRPRRAELRADELNNRALSLLDLGRDAEADAALTEALAADPRHVEATYNHGLLRWRRAEIRDDELVGALDGLLATAAEPRRVQQLLDEVHRERGDVPGRRAVDSLRAIPFGVPMFRFSASGGLMLVADPLGDVVRVWDMATGAVLRSLGEPLAKGHDTIRRSIALSRDGQVAAICGSQADEALVYDTRSGRLVQRLIRPEAKVRSLAVDGAGRTVVAGYADSTVVVWDVRSGDRVHVVEHKESFGGKREPVDHLAVSADGRVAVSKASVVDGVLVWNTHTGATRCEVRHLEPPNASGAPFQLSANGTRLLAGSKSGSVVLVDTTSGRVVRTLSAHHASPIDSGHWNGATSVCFDEAARLAITSGNDHDRTVRIWDLSTGRCLRTIDGGSSTRALAMETVWLSGDSRLAMCASKTGVKRWALPDAYVAGFQLARPRGAASLAGHEARVGRLRDDAEGALGDGRLSDALALLTEARSTPGHERSPDLVEAWWRLGVRTRHVDVRAVWPGPPLQDRTGDGRDILAAAVSVSAGLLLSAGDTDSLGEDNTGGVWELATGRRVARLGIELDHSSPLHLAADPDGTVAVGVFGRDGVLLWDVTEARPRSEQLPDPGDFAESPVFSTDGRHVLLSTSEAVTIYDVRTCQRVCRIPEYLMVATMNAAGTVLLSSSLTSDVALWDARSGERLGQLRVPEPSGRCWTKALASTSDARVAVTAGDDGALHVWDTAAGERRHQLTGHQGPVTALAVTADDQFVLSGGADRTMRIWDLETGACLHTVHAQPDELTSVDVTADGRFAVTTSGFHPVDVRVWEIDWTLDEGEG